MIFSATIARFLEVQSQLARRWTLIFQLKTSITLLQVLQHSVALAKTAGRDNWR